MTGKLDYVRHGLGAVRPYIFGNLATARFIAEVLGGEEVERLASGSGFHIEARVGDSMIVLDSSEAWAKPKPASAIYVYVADVDAAYARALAMGATSIEAPADKRYRERACGVKDQFGNTWYLSRYTG